MAKIGLDIGHGNNTFPPSKGVYKNGKGYAEHDFNSKLGVRIKELLEANGHKVILGQQPFSKEVGLTTRTNLYNREKVDLVVSVHANANSSSSVNGRCAFYWHTSNDGKKLAQSIINEIKARGYSTHGNGLHASERGSWTNLHITRETNMPAVLVEHGFMTGNKDFDLVFGSKQDEYIEDMAQADVTGIIKYLGGETVKVTKPNTSTPPKKPTQPKKQANTGGSIVDYLNQQGINSSFDNRKNLAVEYGVVSKESDYKGTASQNTALLNAMINGQPKQEGTRKEPIQSGYKGNSIVDYLVSIGEDASFSNRKRLAKQNGISNYTGTASQNTELLNKLRGGGTSSSGSKSISQMADEIEAGKHGQGHENRRKSLGIDQVTYNKVRDEVNRRAGVSSGSGKSIKQMADEVIAGKHGNGNAQRQKSLGVDNATYQKVRAEVNRRS